MQSDAEVLLERLAGGDQAAFMDFYDAFAPRVFGLLVKLLGDHADAEDVLQEVMWEIWRKAERYNPALGSPVVWVLMVARARAIDCLRKRGKDRRELQRAQQEGGSGLVETKLPDDLSEPIRTAMKQLPEEQSTVIAAAFYHGLTREQIARGLDLPVGTVKTRIRAGVRQLRETFESMEVAH